MKRSVKNALYLGLLCAISYFAVYFTRKVLGVVTPQMIRDGYSMEYIGIISSVYLTAYAAGQLINGIIGDKLNAKYMIGLGLVLAGISNLLFPKALEISYAAAIAVYGMSGFFLSMIYAPMTKLVSENVDSLYVPRCSLGYTFASYISSPAVGVVAAAVSWRFSFITSSILLFVMGCICFLFFTLFEKRGIINHNNYKSESNTPSSGVRALFQNGIVRFTFIAILTGIIRTSVVFWMPTYINQYLGFSEEQSALIFTICTLVISSSAFISVFAYERLKKSITATLILMFAVSTVSFLLLYIIKSTYINIILLTLAVTSSNGAATMLWSVYCPSLKNTGMVSSATGFLDCVSYIAAAVSSTLFANAVTKIGWRNLILVWFLLMIAGIFAALPYSRIRRNVKKEENI